MNRKLYVAAWGLGALVAGVGSATAQPVEGVGLFGAYVTLRLVTVLVLFATPMETFIEAATQRMRPSGGGD